MKKQAIAFAMCCSFAAVFLSPLTSYTATTSEMNKAVFANPAKATAAIASEMNKVVSANPAKATGSSPVVPSGNVVQVPVNLPTSSIDVCTILKATLGIACAKS